MPANMRYNVVAEDHPFNCTKFAGKKNGAGEQIRTVVTSLEGLKRRFHKVLLLRYL